MAGFLQQIPNAAESPFAFAAYAICAALFILVGARIRRIRLVLRQLRDIPEKDRRRVIGTITNSVIPESITADQWIRSNRNRYLYELGAVVALLASAIAVITLLRGTPSAPSTPPSTAEARAEAQRFLRDMDSGKYSAAYDKMLAQFRNTFSRDMWLKATAEYRAPLGVVENRLDSDSEAGEQTFGHQSFNVLAFSYLTKFSDRSTRILEIVTLASPGRPVPWRVAGYHINSAPPQ